MIGKNQTPDIGKDTQFKPGQSGNPDGKPKGTKHLSTYIQEALTDENFELKLKDGTILKEMPIKAIIKTAVAKSVSGDTRAMEWLAKHGYGTNLNIEFNKNPAREVLEAMDLVKKEGGDDGQATDNS